MDPKDSNSIVSSFEEFQRPGVDVKAYITHDWVSDPMAKGTWCCWGPNSMGKWLKELQKTEGKILFASADWADGWRGFIDGAIERGIAAATEVKNSLEKDRVRSML
jgi:monoamine oxidase